MVADGIMVTLVTAVSPYAVFAENFSQIIRESRSARTPRFNGLTVPQPP